MLRRKMTATAVVLAATLMPCLAAQAADDGEPQRFDDHKLLLISLQTQRDLRAMLSIGAVPWACRVGVGDQPFSVSPEQLEVVRQLELDFEVLADNVQRLFDEEREAIEAARHRAIADDDWFAVYRTTAEVNDYIDDLVALRPDLVEKLVVGTSIEGRTIYAMRITNSNRGGDEKPAVLFNGAQHAREWISVMVPMYIADQLVRTYGDDARVTAILDNVAVYIVPIVNPDGYEFSQLPGNRMWRKNRRNNPGSSCFGVDLNRNWDHGWGGPHSTSSNPCTDIFIGSGAESEPEVAALAAFMQARPNIAAHVDIHNFSELVLHAWGDTTTPHPDADEIVGLAALMSDAIYSVHGVHYPYGTPGELLYMVSGSMQDWVTSIGAYGYTIEVRPSTFNPGFQLPPDQILPTSEENYEAALVMAEWVAQGVVFTFPEGVPDLIDAQGGTSVPVKATPVSSGDLDPASATLFMRTGAGGFMPVSMSYLGNNVYEATFPPVDCGVEVEFYFEIASTAGAFYQSPLGAPSNVFTATAANLVEQVVLAEDFADGLPAGWSASGLWHAGTSCPVSQPCEPQWMYYGIGGFCHYNTGGANAGELTSASISVPAIENGSVELRFCYNLQTENSLLYDIAEFSIDGGPWHRMSEAPTWTTHTVDVSSYAGQDIVLRWRFDTVDGFANNYRGWQVTDVRVTANTAHCPEPPTCQGDLTGDGVVDVSDLLILLGAWGACADPNDCPADFTGDGVVDVSDLLILLGSWGPCE